MLELIAETMRALQAETALYPPATQIWMRVMGLSFAAGIVFAFNKPGARWIVAALLLNIAGLVAGKLMFADATRMQIGTIVHLLFWAPILWIVWNTAIRATLSSTAEGVYNKAYVVWLYWASLLMAISLVFDLRTAIMMLV
ncbi:MAG: hypothetical protein KJP04_09565 [Arenicella sp.]|nr:hypothetical protein [Arenicella sp.]